MDTKLIEDLRVLALKIYNNQEIIKTYKKLASLCKKNGLLLETSGLYKNLFHLKGDFEYFKKMGDVLVLDDKFVSEAYSSYEIYLSNTYPTLYKNYKKCTKILGSNLEYINTDIDFNTNKELVTLTDRVIAIGYIIILAYKFKAYDFILELDSYIDKIKADINTYLNLNNIIDKAPLDNMKNAEIYVSKVLACTDYHNDINRLAIKYNPVYEAPYLNIIEDMLHFNNYENALDFYNNSYAPKFKSRPFNNEIELSWFIAGKYNDYGDVYNAVKYQKKAIELELNK